MPNIFFLYGNDEFAISRKLKDFESDFSDPTSADMNTARLDARSLSEDSLSNALNAMPFLAKMTAGSVVKSLLEIQQSTGAEKVFGVHRKYS